MKLMILVMGAIACGFLTTVTACAPSANPPDIAPPESPSPSPSPS